MSELKIKVTWDGMAIELEGETESVKEIFNSLKESGMGNMGQCGKKAVNVSTNNTETIRENENTVVIGEEDFEEMGQPEIPTLLNVVLAGGPRTESEWILIYAFYISNQGAKFFSREDLRQCYKDTNRYTETRSKNFSSNIKILISEKLISAVNKTDFRIERKGIELALGIICGEIEGKSSKVTKKKTSKSKSSTTDTYSLVELNLSQDERNMLAEFYTTHAPANNQDKTVVIAKWLKDTKGIEEVNKDIIFTALRTLGESTSFNINQTLLNAKNQKSYFTSSEVGKFKINHIGEDHVDRDMLGKDK